MLTNMLDLTCNVESVSTGQTAFGGQTKTYSTRLTSVPCSFKTKAQTPSSESEKLGKQTVNAFYTFYMEAPTANLAIIESDRILFDSDYYDIERIYNIAGKNRLLQIDCIKVE